MSDKYLQPLRIVDVLVNKSMNNRYYVILDRKINFKYEEVSKNIFVGKDGPFYTALKYEKGSKDAFAGRGFTINMVDGTKRICDGDHWDIQPINVNTASVGTSSINELNKCHVFCSAHIDIDHLNSWLANNDPKPDYYFYKNYPTQDEAKEVTVKWRKEKCNSYYAFNMDNGGRMRVHAIKKMEKEIEEKTRKINSLNEFNSRRANIIEGLLKGMLDIMDWEYEELENYTENLLKEHKFTLYDFLEPDEDESDFNSYC